MRVAQKYNYLLHQMVFFVVGSATQWLFRFSTFFFKVCNVLLARVCYDHRFEMCSYYYHQINGEKMGLSPILAVIYTVTIGTTLNFNSGNKGHRLKTLRVNRP